MRNSRLAGGLAALAVLLVLLVSAPAVLAAVPAPNPGAVGVAQRYLGVPYVSGGTTSAGLDAPGLTRLVYRKIGIWLPQTIARQAAHGRHLTRAQLKPGDLVFDASLQHAGIFIGSGTVITAPHEGSVVSYLGMSKWGDKFVLRRYNAATGYHAAMLVRRYLGVPYVYGGASPSGFDASGLTMYVYAQLGAKLSHGATDQQHASTPIPLASLKRGDLVFFGNPEYSHHVGIYIGQGRMIHAPHAGAVVQIDPISALADAWIGGRFLPVR